MVQDVINAGLGRFRDLRGEVAFTTCSDVSETCNKAGALMFLKLPLAGFLPLYPGKMWVCGCAVGPPGRSFSRLRALSLALGLDWIWQAARGNASCVSVSYAFPH